MKKYLLFSVFILPLLFGFITVQIIGEDRLSVFDGYPVPKDENMIFYIQKSYNENTVVYVANIGEDGKLDPKKPVKAFWRRYQEQGQKRELKYFERTFGYGVHSKALKGVDNTYIFTLVSLKDMDFVITQNKNGKPFVATKINGKRAHLERVYVTAEHVKVVPTVFTVEIFGKELKTNNFVYQKFIQKEQKNK